MIFTPPYYLSRVKGYSQLLLCEAPKPSICDKILDPQREIPITHVEIYQRLKARYRQRIRRLDNTNYSHVIDLTHKTVSGPIWNPEEHHISPLGNPTLCYLRLHTVRDMIKIR